jgi:hypothetical protein
MQPPLALSSHLVGDEGAFSSPLALCTIAGDNAHALFTRF